MTNNLLDAENDGDRGGPVHPSGHVNHQFTACKTGTGQNQDLAEPSQAQPICCVPSYVFCLATHIRYDHEACRLGVRWSERKGNCRLGGHQQTL